jgi:hypothetical protein
MLLRADHVEMSMSVVDHDAEVVDGKAVGSDDDGRRATPCARDLAAIRSSIVTSPSSGT